MATQFLLPVRVSHYPRRDGPLPDGVKWVGRPSRWGNPWRVGPQGLHDRTATEVVDMYRRLWVHRLGGEDHYDPDVIWFTEKWVADLAMLAEFEGLACSCPIGEPCHVDVLIELLGDLPKVKL